MRFCGGKKSRNFRAGKENLLANPLENVKTICSHHYAIYFDYYDTPRFHFSKNCCDPFKKHNRAVCGIHKISLQFSDKVLAFKDELLLIPGKTLCFRCFTQLNVSSSDPQTPRQYENPHSDEINQSDSSPCFIRKVITPRHVIDALSRAEIITPITDLNKSNEERRSRICASTFEDMKRNILSVDEASSPKQKKVIILN